MTLILAVAAAVLCSCGTYLILQRQLSRVVIGVGLMGHGANTLLILSAAGRGRPAFGSGDGGSEVTDPLPQALALTAIVITFGVIAFLLALAYSQLGRHQRRRGRGRPRGPLHRPAAGGPGSGGRAMRTLVALPSGCRCSPQPCRSWSGVGVRRSASSAS
jgi:multicomponent Na+:H+ antiporter subunit C